MTFTKWDVSVVLVDEGHTMTAKVVCNSAALSDAVVADLLGLYAGILQRACEDAGVAWYMPAVPAAMLRPGRRQLLSAVSAAEDR